MKNATIVESNVEPSKENLWLYKGELRQFGPNGWEAVSASDNAPKYIFNVIRDFQALLLSPSNQSGRIIVDSYTEQDGVKETVPITSYTASSGIVSVLLIRASTGRYLVDIFTKGIDGNDLVIIEGHNGRQVIVPVIVSGFGDISTTTTTTSSTPIPEVTTTTSTSTKPPVSVIVRNSTSLGLVVGGVNIEGEVGTSSPPIDMGQEIICYPRPDSSITISRFEGTILPQLIIRDAIMHTEIPNSRMVDGKEYNIDCDNILGLIQEGLTTIEVVEDTTSSLE